MTAVPPQPTLTDGEITLRPWRDDDVDLAPALEDEQIAHWSGSPRVSTRDDLAAAVRRWHEQYDDDRSVVNFAVELAGVDGPVGTVEVRRCPDGVGDVRWTTYKPFRGRRVAPRAVRMLASYAFTELGLERLHAEVDAENRPSSRVALRAGFRREGVLRGSATLGGERRDMIVYGLRRDDPAPDTVLGWTTLMDSVLPKKRVIAHVVVRDTGGRVLLCTTSYKRDLELPGGAVEPGEDPLTAARRELVEEPVAAGHHHRRRARDPLRGLVHHRRARRPGLPTERPPAPAGARRARPRPPAPRRQAVLNPRPAVSGRSGT